MENKQLLLRAIGITEETPDFERDFSIYSLMKRDDVSDIAIALYALVVDMGEAINPFEHARSSEEAVAAAVFELTVLGLIEVFDDATLK